MPLSRKKKITSAQGDSIAWRKTETIETEDTYALCRCGQSGSKPFCDGTHARVGFDGTELADTRPTTERIRIVAGSLEPRSGETVFEGAGLVVKRDGYLCMHAAFCVGRLKRIPEMMEGVDDSDVRAQIIGMMERCPSGSYMYALTPGGRGRRARLPGRHRRDRTRRASSPGSLWVTGGIPLVRSDGQPFETRNRMTLCRCGHSQMKPLCDGTHREIDFRERSETAAAAARLSSRRGRRRVHADAVVARPAAERDPLRLGQLDREARRRADADEDRAAGERGLLHELEREPAAEAEDRVAQRQPAGAERPADDLVERVVPADVLAHADERRRRASNRPAAWSPPVSANVGCASRSRCGSAPSSSQPTRRSDSTGGACTRTASAAPLPQTPHEDEV